MAKQKNTIPTPEGLAGKIKVLDTKRKNMRKRFTATEEVLGHKTKKLATIAKERKIIRNKLTVTEKNIYQKTKKIAVLQKKKILSVRNWWLKPRCFVVKLKNLLQKQKRW